MIVDGREIVFTEHFFEQLANIQTQSSVYSAIQGRQLSTSVIDFVIDIIAPNPYIFVEYEGLRTSDGIYRRAIFKRKYALIYKVFSDRIDVLTIYYVSQNPDAVDLGDSL